MSYSLDIHHQREAHPDTSIPDTHQDPYSKTILGFWIYLMTDCLLFASFFATYAVLHNNTFGGPSAKEIFSLPLAFAETMILLFSSITAGFSVLAAVSNHKKRAINWLTVTFLLGAGFIALELTEFTHLVREGNSWTRSGFLSAFFALLGLHGTHVTFGLLWIMVMILQLIYYGITTTTFRRLVTFSLFWHFLDLVWIFIFTFVYLMGVL